MNPNSAWVDMLLTFQAKGDASETARRLRQYIESGGDHPLIVLPSHRTSGKINQAQRDFVLRVCDLVLEGELKS